MKSLLCLLGLLSYTYCTGQAVQTAPAQARTGAYGNLQNNAFSFITNQGALSTVKNRSAALYGEQRFLLQELSIYHLAFTLPATNSAFGLHLAYAGNPDFNASVIGFAYGRKLRETIGLGVQFNYNNQHLRGYGNAVQVTAEAGVLVHLSDAFHLGLQASNAAGLTLGKSIAKQPAIYTFGVEYDASQNLAVTVELIKIQAMPLAVQTGMAYHFANRLWAKAGINSGTAAFYIAAGFQVNDFRIEVAGSVHPQLGLSPALMLLYNNMGK